MKTLLVTCSISVLTLSVGCNLNSPQTARTTNVQAQWHADFLNKRYASIFNGTNGVGLVQSGPNNPTTFVLKIGASFDDIDHHSYTKYTILRMDDDGALIEYFSQFDHRSFGKGLIEKNSGTFKLKWKLAQ